MNKKSEKFTEAYKATSDKIRTLIDSDALGIFSSQIINSGYGVESNNKHIITVIIGYRLLNVITPSEVVAELKELGLNSENIELVGKKIENFVIDNSDNISKLNLEINETETTQDSSTQIRTMAKDMVQNSQTEEVVYSSTQSAILNESKPKTEAANSWGSEAK